MTSEHPLVWVTQGKTQHLAYLLEESVEEAVIRWESTNQRERVPPHTVARNLLPRQRNRPKTFPGVHTELSQEDVSEQSLSSPRKRAKSKPSNSSEQATRGAVNNYGTAPCDGATKDCSDGLHVDDDIESVETREDFLLVDLVSRNKAEVSASDVVMNQHSKQDLASLDNEEDEADQRDKWTNPSFLDSKGYKSELGTPTEVGYEPTPEAAKPSFSYCSSAYVQNLAEICYTIMNDLRWHVGDKLLFAWEYGDDLSAILAFEQLFQCPPAARRGPCSCLMCKAKPEATPEVGAETLHAIDEVDLKSEDASENDGLDDKAARELHLYSRMFYRKGPWFRLDDLFTRYYAPQKTESGKGCDMQGYQQSAKSSNGVDEGLFQESLQALKLLLHDVRSLRQRGYIRTFRDEEECGKVAGAVSQEGSGVLFSAEERRSILSKLGGSTKKKENGYKQGKIESSRENEIWKQMRSQRSIAAGWFGDNSSGSSRCLLPVRNHVNSEVLSKLASNVVLAASCVDYVPAGILRSKLFEVKACFSEFLLDECDTVFRLREEPQLALRRCCRLFLCATCGPGDMRGDGTNGWKSLRDPTFEEMLLPLSRSLSPPGTNTWHATVYPGMTFRFGLHLPNFMDSYIPLPRTSFIEHESTKAIQVFSNLASFRAWELSVEIRANVDYLIELNEFILYEARRRLKESEGEENPTLVQRNKNSSFKLGIEDQFHKISKLDVDFLRLLEKQKRRHFLSQLCHHAVENASGFDENDSIDLFQDVEVSIDKVFSEATTVGHDEVTFQTDCEKVLVVIAIIAMNLLRVVYKNMSADEQKTVTKRCWLRHLWPEGVLAYVLWDCIPILEKRGLHELAIRGLEILVFGTFQYETWRSGYTMKKDSAALGENVMSTSVGDVMISRRARGKAIERLVIDYTHALRKERALTKAEGQNSSKMRVRETCTVSVSDFFNPLCEKFLREATESSFISFAAIRALARRLRKPLDKLLENGGGAEATLLGLRLRNASEVPLESSKTKGYVDWAPKTDQTVAVALTGSGPVSGGRCSYVGFEDGQFEPGSLNVEQLAMEYYGTGRLPKGDAELSGGSWVGWHDEGGRIRTLFRILCAAPILGMDGGCGSTTDLTLDQYTIHLTKYQGAPFDLHVGSWNSGRRNVAACPVNGFYARRRKRIEEFLTKLEEMTPQALADCVYEAVERRAETAICGNSSNAAIARDVQQLRTLCMLAAGFGGKLLSAAFRCIIFDYRHYSGGLPDLLLTRALYADLEDTTKEFVDLGEWIGEEFSEQAKAEHEAQSQASFLIDRDADFLGCSKVGDSGARTSNRWSRPSKSSRSTNTSTTSLQLPAKLVLSHKSRPVLVQTLFVEVKSHNDRLDGRQEDWLNLLDRVGNARVCKFVNWKNAKKTLSTVSRAS
jgi:hypothetical protein